MILDVLATVVDHTTDVLIMHDGPDSPQHGFRGSSSIREVVELARPTLVVRGHSHWKLPFVELASGVQVLNVDCRVVLLHEGKGH